MIGVKATYTIKGEAKEAHNFDSSTVEEARVGLPIGVDSFASKPGDYSYSGSHDSGPLPTPREGGVMAQLIGCVQRAKQGNDEYLTAIIQQEKQDGPDPKRSKTDKE